MKFIVDAHLPMLLVKWIKKQGYDAIHTLNLPNKNATEDIDIIKLSIKDKRIVISKDGDFYEYYLLHQQPHKLIMITTGNIINKELINLFENNFSVLVKYLEDHNVIELSNYSVTVHV